MFKNLKYLAFVLSMIAIILYAIIRILFTLAYASNYTGLELVIGYALLFSELFMLVHALGYTRHLLASLRGKELGKKASDVVMPSTPTVAILVAARHEPREVLEQTFRSLTNLHYPLKSIYFLDDSSDQKYLKEAEEISKKYDLKLFRRKERHGAKAGIINDCLKGLKEDYICIFDADQNPMPSFLNPLIPLLEADKKLAFIQTPQFYSNLSDCPVAHGAAYQQAIFYEYICESKSSKEAMFCCGTNVVFRREALVSVGGFDESLITEDIATSIRLHMNGWRSLYYNHVGAFGMGPENLLEYFKQQGRWSRGNFGLLRKVLFNFITKPFSMSFNQWWEYFLSSTYYFVGIVFFILMACPILYLTFNIPSFFTKTDIYISVFLPYFSLSLSVFYVTLKSRNYSIKDVWLGQTLTCISFPIHIRSTIMGLLGIQGGFGITLKGQVSKAIPYRYLWPQLSMMLANYIALVWGLNRLYYERNFSIAINCLWVLYHFFIMASVFYFNREVQND